MRFLSILILGSAMMMIEVGAKQSANPEETAVTDVEVNYRWRKRVDLKY